MSFKIFTLWTFILIGRPQDFFPILIPLRPALVFTIITLGATFIGSKRLSLKELLWSGESKKYAFFYLIMILGIPFAYHRREAFNFIFTFYLSNMLFFLIFIIQVDSLKKLKSIIFIICSSIFFYSIFSLTQGSFAYGRFSFGTMYDPNDLAYILVSLFPMSFFYIVHNEGILKKIIAIITVGVSIVTILLTGSRGGLLGLIAVFILFFFTKSGGIKWKYKILLLISLIVIFTLYGNKINMERYMSLTEIESDYNATDEFGRLEIWKRGIQLILSNPITGVGGSCFAMAIGYERKAEGEIPRWQAAHNSYIQVAAEAGLIGFIIFAALIIGCLRNFSHYSRMGILSPETQEFKTIAGLLQVGFIGSLISAFFLTQGYSILFTLFFAFSAVMRNLSTNFGNSKIIA